MPSWQNIQLPNDNFFENIIALIRPVALYRFAMARVSSAVMIEPGRAASRQTKASPRGHRRVSRQSAARASQHSDGKIKPRFKIKLRDEPPQPPAHSAALGSPARMSANVGSPTTTTQEATHVASVHP